MSTPYPHLSKAPITEAVLDIRVEPPPERNLEALVDGFYAAVRNRFPEAKSVHHAQISVSPDDASFAKETLGKIFWNPEKTRAVQAQSGGFTVNHVKKYEDWPTIRGDAQKYWREYVRLAQPGAVTRCALRYINRIEIPTGVAFAKVLHTRPAVATALPQGLEECFFRVVLPFEDHIAAVISFATEPLPDDRPVETRGLIVDIDTFSLRRFAPAEDDLWREFETLRSIKNKCFFESLQQETWEKYK